MADGSASRTLTVTPVTGGGPAAAISTTAGPAASTSSNPYNSTDNQTLSTVMPSFLIAFICVFSVIVACGIFYGRRRRLMLLRNIASAPSPSHTGSPQAWEMHFPEDPHNHRVTKSRRKKRLVKPKLWEVDAVDMCWDLERKFEALEPVAVELQAAPKTTPPSSPAGMAKQSKWHAPWFSRGHKPQPAEGDLMDKTPVTRQAQVMFLVAMPSAARDAVWPEREYAIATQSLPYTPPSPDRSHLEHDCSCERKESPRLSRFGVLEAGYSYP